MAVGGVGGRGASPEQQEVEPRHWIGPVGKLKELGALEAEPHAVVQNSLMGIESARWTGKENEKQGDEKHSSREYHLL
jgi:hypothetical protein